MNEHDYQWDGRYDYMRNIKEDISEYIHDNYNVEDYLEFYSIDEFTDKLNDELWTADSVTGNGSGSYFFNSYKAEEAICHNLDLLGEALQEFGYENFDILKQGAETADVTIRCYLLYPALSEVIAEEVEDDFEKVHEEHEQESSSKPKKAKEDDFEL